MTNLAGIVRDEESARGEWLAMRQGELALTYAELARANGQAAALLREAGVGPGDRVALMLPNVLAFPVVFYGSLAAGAVGRADEPAAEEPGGRATTSATRARRSSSPGSRSADEAAKGAADTGAQVDPGGGHRTRGRCSAAGSRWPTGPNAATTTTRSSCTPRARPARRRAPSSPTRTCTRNAEVTATTLLDRGPDDVIMGCLPLFHVFGLTCGLNATVIGGATLTLLPRFDAGKALEIIGRDRVTIFEGVPTMYAAMLHHPDRASRRHVVAAAVRIRRRGAAGRGPARVRGGVRLHRSWRATGCRRPRRSPRSTTRTASASRARSAPRSPGCEMRVVGRRPAPTCPRGRSARSRSAATT